MNGTMQNNRRFLEVIELLDERYIEEMFDGLKVPERAEEPRLTWRSPFKHWKSLAALAACILLLSAAIPVLNYAMQRFGIGIWEGFAGAVTSELEATTLTEPQTLETEEDLLYGNYLNPIKGLEPLPNNLIAEINSHKNDFTSLSVLNVGIKKSDRYLGCFNGYYIFFDTIAGSKDLVSSTDISRINIAGYEFDYSEGFSLYMYKDGAFINLQEGYMSGTLDVEQIKEIYLRNNEYLRYFNPGVVIYDKKPINQDDLEVLNAVWSAQYGNGKAYAEVLEWTQHILHYCYGWIGESIVFHAPNQSYDGANELIEYMIEDYCFYAFPTYYDIWVFHSGEILLLREAYDKGYISIEDLESISHFNNKYH